jgi:hypothetical protein
VDPLSFTLVSCGGISVWLGKSEHSYGSVHAVSFDDGMQCCGRSTKHGIPCRHQCALARHNRIDAVELVHVNLTMATMQAQYHRCLPIHPVGFDSTEKVPGDQQLAPPDEKVQPGRPKKKRFASMASDNPDSKRRVCGRCGSLGHNKRSCKNPLTSEQQSQGQGGF